MSGLGHVPTTHRQDICVMGQGYSTSSHRGARHWGNSAIHPITQCASLFTLPPTHTGRKHRYPRVTKLNVDRSNIPHSEHHRHNLYTLTC